MKKISVFPLIGFENVKFGMSQEEVRALLGMPIEFRKNIYSSGTTDNFGFCHVFYDSGKKCEAAEFFSDTEIHVEETILLPGKIDNAKKMFPDLHDCGGSLISKEKSVGITVSGDFLESILFGKPNYYM